MERLMILRLSNYAEYRVTRTIGTKDNSETQQNNHRAALQQWGAALSCAGGGTILFPAS